MRSILSSVAIAFIAGVFWQCGSEKTPVTSGMFAGYGLAMDSIIRDTSDCVHGITLGSSRQDVLAREKISPIDADSTFLLFDRRIDSIGSYTIAYSMVGDTVEEIEIRILEKSLEAGNVVLNDLKRYFDIKYGTPVQDNGIYVYAAKDKTKGPILVSLSDNSSQDKSLLSVLVYREK